MTQNGYLRFYEIAVELLIIYFTRLKNTWLLFLLNSGWLPLKIEQVLVDTIEAVYVEPCLFILVLGRSTLHLLLAVKVYP
mgnify:FL=1